MVRCIEPIVKVRRVGRVRGRRGEAVLVVDLERVLIDVEHAVDLVNVIVIEIVRGIHRYDRLERWPGGAWRSGWR